MKKIALTLLGSALLTACVTTPKPTELPKGTYHYTVNTPCADHLTLKVGESISVQVYDNPSTGYSWDVTGAQKFDAKSAYIDKLPTKVPIIGAGQDTVFIFTAKSQGTDQISLHHGPGWQPLSPAQWSCKVTVQ